MILVMNNAVLFRYVHSIIARGKIYMLSTPPGLQAKGYFVAAVFGVCGTIGCGFGVRSQKLQIETFVDSAQEYVKQQINIHRMGGLCRKGWL